MPDETLLWIDIYVKLPLVCLFELQRTKKQNKRGVVPSTRAPSGALCGRHTAREHHSNSFVITGVSQKLTLSGLGVDVLGEDVALGVLEDVLRDDGVRPLRQRPQVGELEVSQAVGAQSS